MFYRTLRTTIPRRSKIRVPRLWQSILVLSCMAGSGRSEAQVESTGFEPEDGWDAGFSICGPEFAATCSYPITDVCIPGDHVANQNCCEADPNPETGWYMDDTSRHCNQPHIETVHPFSGSQHLRFQPDSVGSMELTVLTPLVPASPPGRTVVSFQIAGGNPAGGYLDYQASAGGQSVDSLSAVVSFGSSGRIYVEPRQLRGHSCRELGSGRRLPQRHHRAGSCLGRGTLLLRRTNDLDFFDCSTPRKDPPTGLLSFKQLRFDLGYRRLFGDARRPSTNHLWRRQHGLRSRTRLCDS